MTRLLLAAALVAGLAGCATQAKSNSARTMEPVFYPPNFDKGPETIQHNLSAGVDLIGSDMIGSGK